MTKSNIIIDPNKPHTSVGSLLDREVDVAGTTVLTSQGIITLPTDKEHKMSLRNLISMATHVTTQIETLKTQLAALNQADESLKAKLEELEL